MANAEKNLDKQCKANHRLALGLPGFAFDPKASHCVRKALHWYFRYQHVDIGNARSFRPPTRGPNASI